MRLQLHLHVRGGQAEDSQCAVAVSCSHARAFFIRERAPTYTAAALECGTGIRFFFLRHDGLKRCDVLMHPLVRMYNQYVFISSFMFNVTNWFVNYGFVGRIQLLIRGNGNTTKASAWRESLYSSHHSLLLWHSFTPPHLFILTNCCIIMQRQAPQIQQGLSESEKGVNSDRQKLTVAPSPG